MKSKPDYHLEFVFTKSKFKKAMWIYLAIWIALRIVRAVIYLTVGLAWLSSIPAVFIFLLTGVVYGFAILTVYIYRRSVRINDIEKEQENINKLQKRNP